MTKQKVTQNLEKSKPMRVIPPEPAQSVKTAVSPPTSDIQRTIDAAANLQQTIGNQAVGRLLIQPKLTVGPVGDRYEQEADAVAKQVVSQLSTSSQATTQRQEEEELPVQAKRVQRQEEDELEVQAKHLQRQEEDELQLKPVQRQEKDELQLKPVQRQEEDELQLKSVQRQSEADYKSGEISADLEQSIQSARGSGQPLADNVRTPMENAFGTDFSGVKVHTDSQSDTLNQSIQARAFTTGQDIFFRQGEYNPGNSSGKELLAHELTHVVQQGGTAVQRKQDKAKTVVQLSQVPDKASPNSTPSPIQRTVAYAGDMTKFDDVERAKDPILLSNMDQALAFAGGPIVDLLSNPDFSTLKPLGTLYIVAHGLPGEAGKGGSGKFNGGLTGKKIAQVLDHNLIPDFVGTILVSACFSGATWPARGIAETLAQQLKEELTRLAEVGGGNPNRKGITVKGTRGPGISNKLWEEREVLGNLLKS